MLEHGKYGGKLGVEEIHCGSQASGRQELGSEMKGRKEKYIWQT